MAFENRYIQIVALDLEATGLDPEDEIIQIAACTRDSSFNVYITPTRRVNPKASEITGMQTYGGYLYLNNQMVYSKEPMYAFQDFMHYLKSLNSGIVFVAHNGFNFDMPRILKLAEEVGYLEEFEALVNGFSDSLIMFRSVLKDRLVQKKRFTMQALVEDLLQVSADNLHNATCDTEMLMSLLDVVGISDEYVIQNARTIHRHYYLEARKTLQYYCGVIPEWMINRLANNRIDRKLLLDIYYSNGYYGIYNLFAEYFYDEPRITENSTFFEAVCNALHTELSESSCYVDQTKLSESNSYVDQTKLCESVSYVVPTNVIFPSVNTLYNELRL